MFPSCGLVKKKEVKMKNSTYLLKKLIKPIILFLLLFSYSCQEHLEQPFVFDNVETDKVLKAQGVITFITLSPGCGLDAFQNAVDEYDIVYLENGVFDFGEDGAVQIYNNVEIVGEKGEEETTILGGICQIFCDAPVTLAVKNIIFRDPMENAIRVHRSTGLTITGCTIEMAEFPSLSPIPIIVSGSNAEDISGNVIIEDNHIHSTGNPLPSVSIGIYLSNLSADVNADINSNYIDFSEDIFSIGIFLDQLSVDVNAEINNNEVRCSATGILIKLQEGNAIISDNKIHLWEGLAPGWGGIAIGCFGAESQRSSVCITRNEVYCDTQHTDGISFWGYGVIDGESLRVEHNKVTGGSLSCYGNVKSTFWSHNKVKGTMGWAIGIISMDLDCTAQDNVFLGNNIVQAKTLVSDVFFDYGAHNNSLAGFSGTVVDLGTGNIITGFTHKHLGPELGQQIKDALARKREAMKELKILSISSSSH